MYGARAPPKPKSKYAHEWERMPPPRDPYDSERWWEPLVEHPFRTLGCVLGFGGVVGLLIWIVGMTAESGPPSPSLPPPPPSPPPPPYVTPSPLGSPPPPSPPPPYTLPLTAPPPPGVVPGAWRWVSDGSTSTNGNSPSVRDICGQQDLTVPQSLCINPQGFTMAGARCCGTATSPGVASSCCYPDSADWYCSSPPCPCPVSGVNYERCYKTSGFAEAEDRCAALGKRLCSKAEVEANMASGAGCYLDFAYVWTSTPCTEGDPPVP